jgi:hypothetical protein
LSRRSLGAKAEAALATAEALGEGGSGFSLSLPFGLFSQLQNVKEQKPSAFNKLTTFGWEINRWYSRKRRFF